MDWFFDGGPHERACAATQSCRTRHSIKRLSFHRRQYQDKTSIGTHEPPHTIHQLLERELSVTVTAFQSGGFRGFQIPMVKRRVADYQIKFRSDIHSGEILNTAMHKLETARRKQRVSKGILLRLRHGIGIGIHTADMRRHALPDHFLSHTKGHHPAAAANVKQRLRIPHIGQRRQQHRIRADFHRATVVFQHKFPELKGGHLTVDFQQACVFMT